MGLRERGYKIEERIQPVWYTVKWRAVFDTVMKHGFQ
jgi:hypothetical protein